MSVYLKPITLVNGQQQTHISIADRGLAYGDGLFETLLLIDGTVPLWTYHYARLMRGLFSLNIELESQRLHRDINQLLALIEKKTPQLFVIKLIVTRGEGGRGYQSCLTKEPTLILSALPYVVDSDKHHGVHVHLCQQQLPLDLPWVGLKTLNQLCYVLAAHERDSTIYDEGLLLSTNDELIEATARNIFIIKKETLYTPLLNRSGVEGVMKQFIIEKIAPQLGFACVEKVLTLADLNDADEVLLTNSVSGIWPVIRYQNKRWTVGPITHSLQAMSHNFLGIIQH